MGDAHTLLMLRVIGRTAFVFTVAEAVMTGLLAPGVSVVVFAVLATAQLLLARHYGFGLTWHHHTGRRPGVDG